jgi:hypothetical protein
MTKMALTFNRALKDLAFDDSHFYTSYCNCEICTHIPEYIIKWYSIAGNSKNKESHKVNALEKLNFTHKTDKVPSTWCLTSPPQQDRGQGSLSGDLMAMTLYIADRRYYIIHSLVSVN